MISTDTKPNISFIGAGKMAAAIAGGLITSGRYTPDQFIATSRHPENHAYFTEKSKVTNLISDNIKAAQESNVIILAVKPQQIEEVCKQIAPYCNNKLVISIAAGTKLQTFYQLLNHERVIRVMPNTPMMVGLGASAFCLGGNCTEQDKELCINIFSAVGKIHQVEENQMDVVTALSGSGPAYVFQFIQSLADAATAQGLQPHIALDLATQTVLGAASMVNQKQGTPDELTRAVTSPNGTTFAALTRMEQLQFKSIIHQIVEAAALRSVELGKTKL